MLDLVFLCQGILGSGCWVGGLLGPTAFDFAMALLFSGGAFLCLGAADGSISGLLPPCSPEYRMSAGEMQDFGLKVLGPAPAMPAKDLSPDLSRGRHPVLLNHFKVSPSPSGCYVPYDRIYSLSIQSGIQYVQRRLKSGD